MDRWGWVTCVVLAGACVTGCGDSVGTTGAGGSGGQGAAGGVGGSGNDGGAGSMTETETNTETGTDTDTDTGTETATETVTDTETRTDTITDTTTNTTTDTNTSSGTGTGSGTSTSSGTSTTTGTNTTSSTITDTFTGTGSGSVTDTGTGTSTLTSTGTNGFVCADVANILECGVGNNTTCVCEGCMGVCDDGLGGFSDCVCPVCAADAFCSDPANCQDDGVCDPFIEGCICADCAAHPLCGGTGTGTGTGTFTGTGTGTCDASNWTADPVCGACLEGSCCGPLEQCQPGSPCSNAIACINVCPPNDDACVIACLNNNPGSQAAIQNMVDCQDFLCNAECSTGICGTTLSYGGLPACNDCLSDNCCTEFLACVADVPCTNCLVGDPAAVNCDVNALYQATLGCQANACGDFCPTPICDSGFTLTDGDCALCLSSNCCTAFTDCGNDLNCSDCITGAGGVNCANDPLVTAVDTCFAVTCSAECN